jgi:ornithine--oxo-acid transaminase
VIERAQIDEAVGALRRVLQAIDAKAGVRREAAAA